VVVLLAVVDLLRIRHDLEHGQAALSALDFQSVDDHGGIRAVANSAASDLHRAAHLARRSPWLSALSNLPGVGDQIGALRDLTGTADQVGALGSSTANDVQTALDRASDRGSAGRVELVDAVVASVERLQEGLRRIDVGAHGTLLAPLRTARADLVRHLQKADTQLDDGRRILTALRGFLEGPRRYLVLGGNNAEMRSVGIATTSGVATVSNGSVEVGNFVDSVPTRLQGPGVPLPEGWDWLFGYLDPAVEYGNDVCSPNFPLTGATAAAIADRNAQGHVDGVIYVDTISLQVLLSVTGPVTVDGVTYDDTNAARILVNENYLNYSSSQRDQRRDSQGRVAKAVFDAINTRHVSLLKLAAKLHVLAQSRHLEAWSRLPAEQQMWHDVGADGARSPNDVMVASEDLGASKLDYYVTEQISMTSTPVGGDHRVDLTIELTNPQRQPTSAYIDGGSIYAKPGEYGTYLVVYMPRAAYDIVHDDPTWTSAANDGPLQATTFTARVAEGTTRRFQVSFVVPGSMPTVNIVPSARISPVRWSYGTEHFGDVLPTAVDLTKMPAPPGPLPGVGWLLAGLVLFAVGAAFAGDGWGRAAAVRADETLVSPRARFDANVGWWMMMLGLAMLAAQIVIYIRA
jgi:hypothetical protein